MSATWLKTPTCIPNCTKCNNWLGEHNSSKKTPISGNKGYEIVIGKCKHAFHGNCVTNTCTICNIPWKQFDKINLGASEWWLVESFWNTYFPKED